jgi:hypothetical protein
VELSGKAAMFDAIEFWKKLSSEPFGLGRDEMVAVHLRRRYAGRSL